jgi:hypothetical protein
MYDIIPFLHSTENFRAYKETGVWNGQSGDIKDATMAKTWQSMPKAVAPIMRMEIIFCRVHMTAPIDRPNNIMEIWRRTGNDCSIFSNCHCCSF